MNFLAIFSLILAAAKPAVLTAQLIHGEAVAGVDKKTMIKTGLLGGLMTASTVLSPQNTALATQIEQLAEAAIDTAVLNAKRSGEYQAATTASLNLPAPVATA